MHVVDNISFSKPEEDKVLDPSPETLEAVLYTLWNSGFLVKDPKTEAEIKDNRYIIFFEDNQPSSCNGCSGMYNIDDLDNEIVYLNENNFVKVIKKGLETHYVMRRCTGLKTMLHELFHDFWFQGLLDEESKAGFYMEAKEIHQEMMAADTEEKKIAFLEHIGIEEAYSSNIEKYLWSLHTEFDERYDDNLFYGTELYSRFAEHSYAKDIIIPKQLRKYYEGIIAKEWLEKDKPK